MLDLMQDLQLALNTIYNQIQKQQHIKIYIKIQYFAYQNIVFLSSQIFIIKLLPQLQSMQQKISRHRNPATGNIKSEPPINSTNVDKNGSLAGDDRHPSGNPIQAQIQITNCLFPDSRKIVPQKQGLPQVLFDYLDTGHPWDVNNQQTQVFSRSKAISSLQCLKQMNLKHGQGMNGDTNTHESSNKISFIKQQHTKSYFINSYVQSAFRANVNYFPLLLQTLILIGLALPTHQIQTCTYGPSCNMHGYCYSGYYSSSVYVNGNMQTQCLYCGVSFCDQCSGPGSCSNCYSGFRYETAGTNRCQPCAVNNGYTLISGDCLSCQDNYCSSCPSNISVCTSCQYGYGVTPSSTCTPCFVPNCASCSSNYLFCSSCINSYGLQNNTCYLCSQRNCSQCSQSNINSCYSCLIGYGLDNRSGNQFCTVCQDSNCLNCSLNYKSCYQCPSRYGFESRNGNQICSPCQDVNCLDCSNNANTCTNCQPGYNPNNGRCECPQYCLTCQYSAALNTSECLTCEPLYSTSLSSSPTRCVEICGDKVAISYPCDQELGIVYDGCDDSCQVEPDFQCMKDSQNISVCSYDIPIVIEVVELKFGEFSNSFQLRLKTQPPLYVFKVTDLTNVFAISDPIFVVKGVFYDQERDEIVMEVDYTADYLDSTLPIQFVPGPDDMYFASVNSSANITLLQPIIFYPQSTFTIATTIKYILMAVLVLGSIALLIGIGAKRLAGLQAMLVYQIAWVSVVWMNMDLYLPFSQTDVLGYTTGYHHIFFPSSSTSSSARLLFSQHQPHLKYFSLDESIFGNNFNIFLLFQALPLLLYFVIWPIGKLKQRRKKQLEEEHAYDDVAEVKVRIAKVNVAKGFVLQCLLTFSVFNLTSFTISGYLFFSHFGSDMHTESLGIFGAAAALYLLTAIVFCCDPDPFDYFRYAFKKTRIGLSFYYVYPLLVAGTVVLLVLLRQQTYFCLIPLACVLLFVVVYRPYSEPWQNVRSVFNLLVILSWLSLRVFIEMSSPTALEEKPQFLASTYYFHLVNVVLLFVVLVVSYVSLFYYMIYTRWYKVKQEKAEEERVLCDLEMVEVRKQMLEIENSDVVFKQILQPRMNLLGFSNSLQTDSNPNPNAILPPSISPQKDVMAKKKRKRVKKEQPQDGRDSKQKLQASQEQKQKQKIEQRKGLGEQDKQKEQKQREVEESEYTHRSLDPKEQAQQQKRQYQLQLQRAAAEQKKQQIKALKLKIQADGNSQDPQQRKNNNKLIYAMEVLTSQNDYLRLKNADEFTKNLVDDPEGKNRHDYIDGYSKI